MIQEQPKGGIMLTTCSRYQLSKGSPQPLPYICIIKNHCESCDIFLSKRPSMFMAQRKAAETPVH